MIRFSTLDVEMPPVNPMRDKAWIEAVAERHGKTIGELYYYFCSDDKLLEINKERLDHDFYTDIVTFPLTDCETVLSSEESRRTLRPLVAAMRANCTGSSSMACYTSSASTTLLKKRKKRCVKKRKNR